jgi:hypothetical protein
MPISYPYEIGGIAWADSYFQENVHALFPELRNRGKKESKVSS